MYDIKLCEADKEVQVKSIDTPKRQVRFIMAITGKKDRVGDVILPKAFNRTISHKISQKDYFMPHVIEHDPYTIAGQIIEAKEEGGQIIATTQLFNENNRTANKALADYEEGLYQHSFGYKAHDYYSEDGVRYIRELELFEGSAVKNPAMWGTKILEIKDFPIAEAIKEINDRVEKLGKALRKGYYEDDVYIAWDLELKNIQSLYDQVITTRSHDIAPAPEKGSEAKEDYSSLLNALDHFKI